MGSEGQVGPRVGKVGRVDSEGRVVPRAGKEEGKVGRVSRVGRTEREPTA